MESATASATPKLASLDAEECCVAAALLHDDTAFLEETTDEDFFYDHTRTLTGAVRMLRNREKPCGAVFVLAVLEPQLDALSWRGDTGEALVLDLLSRRVADPQAYYSRQLGKLVRYYALRRKAMREAQEAAQRTFTETFDAVRKRYEGELGG